MIENCIFCHFGLAAEKICTGTETTFSNPERSIHIKKEKL